MVEYLFVYDERRGSFPVRFQIAREAGHGPGGAEPEEVTAVVPVAEAAARRSALDRAFPGPRFSVSRSWANSWQAVERNYRGLRDHEY